MYDHETTAPVLNLETVKVISPLGRGAKGIVFLAQYEHCSGELWAMKMMWKELVQKKKDDAEGSEFKRVSFEQQVLSRFNHPLLPRLRGVLSTERIVGYAIDYCPGGDLHSLRMKQSEKMFSVDSIRFYAAEIVLALEYLHSLGVAYRDLKPENILIQESGHLMLVDFDLSTNLLHPSREASPASNPARKPESPRMKRFSLFFCNSGISPEDYSSVNDDLNSSPPEAESGEKSNSFVGTEEYVAPEVIRGFGHDFAVDWWSFGVVLYEMLYGATPFKGENRKETFYKILTKSPELVGEATPLRDLIRKLLVKNPAERIRVEEIKGHDFFRGVDWDWVVKIARPPYIPRNEGGVVEGKIGIKKSEVEIIVQGIFGGDVVENNKVDVENINKEKENNKTEEETWVKGLHNNHCENEENFLVF